MIKLVAARLLHDQVLHLRFSDGSEGDLDFAPILAPKTDMTRPLAKPEAFARFFLELGALCWPNGLQFSPRSMQEKLKQSGALRHPAAA